MLRLCLAVSTYTNGDGTALARLLDGDGVRFTEVGTPVTTTNWHNRKLRDDDGSADGSCDFLGGLDAESNVSLAVTNDDDGLETGTLTGTGLLLDRLDLCCNCNQHVAPLYASCMCESVPS